MQVKYISKLILISSLFPVLHVRYTMAQSISPGNLVSTAKIVVKSCYVPGVNDEKTAWRFFGCYDGVAGKDLFVKCQKRTFNGRLFDRVRNFRRNCSNPFLIPTYARCLRRLFRKAGLDMNASVRKLNACQLRLFR